LQHRKLPEIIVAAMERGGPDSGLDEQAAAAHTLGPILYKCLFGNKPIRPADIERTIDAFLDGDPLPALAAETCLGPLHQTCPTAGWVVCRALEPAIDS